LGLNTRDFYDLTPIEWYYAGKDFAEREHAKTTELVKATWEAMRLQTLHLYQMNPHIKKEHRPKHGTDLFTFPWDSKIPPKKQEVVKQTTEQMKSFLVSFANKNS